MSMPFTFKARKLGSGLGAFPTPKFSQLGVMYTAKSAVAELKTKYNLDVKEILFRADAHPWTINTGFTNYKKDPMHLTFDVKTADMLKNNQHLTIHAYIKEDPTTGVIENMFNVASTVPKFKKGSTKDLAIENDSYLEPQMGKNVNNWDPTTLDTFPEPPEFQSVTLGTNWIAVMNTVLEKMAKDQREKAKKEAVDALNKIRDAYTLAPVVPAKKQ